MALACLTAKAQNANVGHHDMVHLTTNLLYDAALVPNVGVEGCDIILGQPMAVTSVTRAVDGRTSFEWKY